MVGMHLGVDLIRYEGRYYLLENNQGASIYRRRRDLYKTRLDPIVSGIVTKARGLGFDSVVPIAFRWQDFYFDEFRQAAEKYGIAAEPVSCPLPQGGQTPRVVALPQPLRAATMYVLHAGLTTPVTRFIDDKWQTAQWLERALREDLPKHSLLATPQTWDRLNFPLPDPGPRWPNVVAKLAGGSRSRNIIIARVRDEREARRLLGLSGRGTIPRRFRLGLLRGLLVGQERVIYQSYIPPETDARGHAQMIRAHLFLAPMGSTLLSVHYRVARKPIPQGAFEGVVMHDGSYVFNEAEYRLPPPEVETEVAGVVEDLIGVMDCAIRRVFQTGPESSSTTPGHQPCQAETQSS